MAKRRARKVLRKYFGPLQARICDVEHLLRHLRRKGLKVVRR